jgi:4'-phosphopantetheinyl transferase
METATVSVTLATKSLLFPKTGLTLSRDEVHVWRMELDLPLPRLLHLARTLSADEMDRASRFRSVYDRNRFIARRGILRQICAAYLAMEPGRLAFDYGPWGKPYLSKQLGPEVPQFSVSYSHSVALYAMTSGREVGVDIERIRSDVEWESIAGMCLSAREIALLRAVPAAARTGAFFTLWTRKEAYIKARGTGLSTRLNQIDVLGRRTHCGVLAKTHGRWQEPWFGSLQDLNVGQQDAAALAVEDQGLTLVYREWY